MASILIPKENKLSRGTKSNPSGTGKENLMEMNAMSLRSGKRKVMINAEDVITPQKENIMKRRRSNKIDILNDKTTEFFESRKTNEMLSTPSQPIMKKKKNASTITKRLRWQNDSVVVLTPKPKAIPNSLTKANTSSTVQNKTAKNCATESENESIIILSPEMSQSNNSKQNIFNNLDAIESKFEVKQFLKDNTIIGSNSLTAPGPSRNHMNDSLDSFILEPLPEDASQLVDTSSDSEISMTLNTTYDLEDTDTQNAKSIALSTRKSVHFKNSPEILGPIRRSISFPNLSLDSSSNDVSENLRQRISTPAARRRAGSTPVPSRKQGSSATKLPNFGLIHKRNFEKMESIYDFHHRRKGSSQKKYPPAVQESKLPRNNNVMVFKATASSTPLPSTSRIPVSLKRRSTPLNLRYSEAKEAVTRKTPVKKTPSHSTPVENNRIVLKGVRLNRRFELLMKHRNMK